MLAAAMLRAAEEDEARLWRGRGASLAVIERNTYRHAYRQAPHHHDEKCTICLSIFEIDSDCRYTTVYCFVFDINIYEVI